MKVEGKVSITDTLNFLGERSGILDGLVITGGEPTLQPGLSGFIRAVKKLGLKVKLDSNGSRPEFLEKLLSDSLLDYIAMDIKAPQDKYRLLCGCSVDLSKIRRSIDLIAASGVDHLFRTTVYKKLLSDQDIEQLKKELPQQSTHVIQHYVEPK